MSLILRGAPSGTVYAQNAANNLSASTAISVYVKFIPSANASVPFVFAMDGNLNGSPRGFALTQNSPTSASISWLTSTGAHVHTFTVASGTEYDVVAVFDVTAATINFYVNSDTPSQTFTSVGTPVTPSQFRLRLVSSLIADENVIIGDFAVWNNGKPSAAALTAINDNAYLGYAFLESNVTHRYLMTGTDGPLATLKFWSINNDGAWLGLEQESISGQPQSTTGPYLAVPNDEILTQSSTSIVTYWDKHNLSLNLFKGSNPTWKWSATEPNRDISDLVSFGYFDEDLGRFTSVPPRYEGLPEWDTVVSFITRGTSSAFVTPGDDDQNSGIFVLEWEGNATFTIRGASTVNVINSNRIEYVGGTTISLDAISPGSYAGNIRNYRKQHESVINSGRLFNPTAVEYWSRYDTIRTMDSSSVNIKHHGSWAEFAKPNSMWQDELPIKYQIQLAIETDTKLWINVSPMLGSNLLGVDQEAITEWGTFSYNQFPNIESSGKVEQYFTNLVATLDEMGWPLDRDIKIEAGNELWNYANPFYRAADYCHGVKNYIEDVENADVEWYSGIGFISAMYMTAFKNALVAGGRASQVWTPILGAQTGYAAVIGQVLKGAEHYLSTRPSTFTIAEYVPSTTGYHHIYLDWTPTNDWLGQAYSSKSEYYTALQSLISSNKNQTLRLMADRNMKITREIIFDYVADNKLEYAPYGVTRPIQEYEGSSHNTPYDEEWRNIPALNSIISEYNNSQAMASAQRMMIESFSMLNRGGAISNFQNVGGSVTDPVYSAWFEALKWDELDTSLSGAVWADYIDPPKDLAVVWSNYQARMAESTGSIDPDLIRSTFISLPTDSEVTSRSNGSVFNSSIFDGIDFDNGEFFYKQNVGDATYFPINGAGGNFSGFFDIFNEAYTSTIMYFYETNTDTWYRFTTNVSGPRFNYTVNNVINAALGSSVYITGTIYGTDELPLSGAGIQFSNDSGSTWVSNILLNNGVTQYRKLVTAAATNDTVTVENIAITSGINTYTDTGEVLTAIGANLAFANATEAFDFSESYTGVIATFTASATKVPTYSLSGADSALFTVNSTGQISPVSAQDFASPSDANTDGIYLFTLTATYGAEVDSVDITATLTEADSHVFTFTGIIDQSGVVPASSVVVTGQLLGGINGIPFAVTGMTSSNNGINGTYTSANKNYVTGSTYIRFTHTAASFYSDVDTVSGTVSAVGGGDLVNVEFDVTTKAALIPVDIGADVRVETTAQTTTVDFLPNVIAGDGVVSYAITGGANAGLFSINSTTGILTWNAAPDYDVAGGVENDYLVEVTASNTDGFTTETSVIVVTVEVIASTEAVDLGSLTIMPRSLTDGSWTTDPGNWMIPVGDRNGDGIATVKEYHDVMKFVRAPKTLVFSIDSIANITGGTAGVVLGGKYILTQSTNTSPMTMDITVRDSNGGTMTFAYTITYQ